MEIIKTGYLEENTYILTKDKTIIIDPGDDADKIINYLESNNLELDSILITHHHFDHIGALNDLLNYKKVLVYDNTNLEEKLYNIAGFNIEVIYTPGHTNDSITYYFKDENIMFTGDFIFKETIGRTDLGGNNIDMKNSINKIIKYDKNIKIYPGHGDYTTLAHELDYNPFFN